MVSRFIVISLVLLLHTPGSVLSVVDGLGVELPSPVQWMIWLLADLPAASPAVLVG
jgi:hypothetical protein